MKDWKNAGLDYHDLDDLIEMVQEELESIKVPGTSYDMADYIHGRCHLFAQALHQEFGYEMECLWDDDFWFDGADGPSVVLVHAYCITPDGTRVDARGLVTKEIIEREYDCNSHFYEKISFEQMKTAIKKRQFCAQDKNELKAITNFIQENRDNYQ